MGLPYIDLTVSASSDLLTLASAPGAHSWIIFFLDISTLFVDPYVSSILHKSGVLINLLFYYCPIGSAFLSEPQTDMRGRINNLGRSKKTRGIEVGLWGYKPKVMSDNTHSQNVQNYKVTL